MKTKDKVLAIVGLGVLLGIAPCVDAYGQEAASGDCQGQIVGSTAEVTGDCTLLAYRYADGAAGPNQLATSLPQTLVSRDDSSEDGHLSVEVPNCFWQIDLVRGDANIVESLTVDNHYSSQGALVASLHGGTTACETIIVTTTTTQPVTTTTVLETTTTAPEVTTAVTPTTQPELARTGTKGRLPFLSLGFSLTGIGLVWLSEIVRKERTS